MSHMPKWIAEFAMKDLNECAERNQEQKAMRAERYKARVDRAAAIAEKHTEEERLSRHVSATTRNDKHDSVPLTKKRKCSPHDDEQFHQRKKLRSSFRKTNKRRFEITTGSADLSDTYFCVNKKEVGLCSNQVKEEIVVYERKNKTAVEVSQPDKSRDNATGSADLSGTSFRMDKDEVVLSTNRVEEEIVLNKNKIERPVVASQPDKSRDNAEAEKPEYVYRLQRFGEPYMQGLYPKTIWSRTSLMDHVARGSKGATSRFISCCKTLYDLQCLGGITNESTRIREVVRINITRLKNYKDVTVIDLTDETVREKHILRSSNAWRFASRFNEVILDPCTHVPADCVEKIGIVQHRKFIKDEHVIL